MCYRERINSKIDIFLVQQIPILGSSNNIVKLRELMTHIPHLSLLSGVWWRTDTAFWPNTAIWVPGTGNTQKWSRAHCLILCAKKWYWTTTYYVCGSLFNEFTLEQQWFCRIWSKSATSPISVTIGLSQNLSILFNCSPFCLNPCMTRQGRASNMHTSCQFLSSRIYKVTLEPEPKIDKT